MPPARFWGRGPRKGHARVAPMLSLARAARAAAGRRSPEAPPSWCPPDGWKRLEAGMCFGVPHNFRDFGGRVYFDDFWAWDLQLRVGFGQSMLRSGGVQPCSVRRPLLPGGFPRICGRAPGSATMHLSDTVTIARGPSWAHAADPRCLDLVCRLFRLVEETGVSEDPLAPKVWPFSPSSPETAPEASWTST